MTNKEKAIELAIKEYPIQMSEYSNGVEYDSNESDRETFIEGAIAIGDWKDAVLRETRTKAINKFNTYYDNKLNHNIQERCLGIVFMIDEILEENSINELHCSFVTLD